MILQSVPLSLKELLSASGEATGRQPDSSLTIVTIVSIKQLRHHTVGTRDWLPFADDLPIDHARKKNRFLSLVNRKRSVECCFARWMASARFTGDIARGPVLGSRACARIRPGRGPGMPPCSADAGVSTPAGCSSTG